MNLRCWVLVLALLLGSCAGGSGNGDTVPGGDAGIGGDGGLDAATDQTEVVPGPRMVLSLETLDFGAVSPGNVVSRVLEVSNRGDELLQVTGFRLSGDSGFVVARSGELYPVSEETEDGITFESPLEVEPSQTMPLATIIFHANGDAPAHGVFQVFSNDPDPVADSVALSGNEDNPRLTTNPEQIVFGNRYPAETAGLPLDLLSSADRPISIFGISLVAESSPDFAVDLGALDHEPSQEDPLVLEPWRKVVVRVLFTPDQENPTLPDGTPVADRGTLEIRHDGTGGVILVPLSGYSALQACPTAIIEIDEGIEVIPQTTLHLHGENSFGGGQAPVVRWEWEVEQPVGSASVFIPNNAIPSPEFEVNVAGKYRFLLRVWDSLELESCMADELEVTVIPDEAIHVELLWSTPGDKDETDEGDGAGSDMDLHFAHWFASMTDQDGDGLPDPWFDQPFDCFWFNAHPKWGSFDPNVDDDPGLDRDDTDGAGPENVNLAIPETTPSCGQGEGADCCGYKIGIHYWNDHGYGPATATVRVYLFSLLVFEDSALLSERDVWEVGCIRWPEAAVIAAENATGGKKITAGYAAPF